MATAWREELLGLGEARAPSVLWPLWGSGLKLMLGVAVVGCVSGVVDVGGERVFKSGAMDENGAGLAMI